MGIERREPQYKEMFRYLKRGIIPNESVNCYYKILMGKLQHRENGVVTNEYSKMYDRSRYKFMLDSPYEVSHMCCDVMKKKPAKKYAKESQRVPITGQMASESKLRTQQWLLRGCNAFDDKTPMSNPLSVWTEQDILLYIKMNNLPICSVYGDVVEDNVKTGQLDGQMSLTDYSDEYGLFDIGNPTLKTTGCSRTGCMFCGFGCHLEKAGEGRFERMRETHPKQYQWIMKPWADGGLGYKEVIDWINEHGNLDIKY